MDTHNRRGNSLPARHVALAFILLFISSPSFSAAKNDDSPVFRTSIIDTPASLDPLEHRQSINSYLLNSIYRTLFTYRDNELRPELAKSCHYKTNRHIECELKAAKYNDGTDIRAADFVRTLHAAFKNKALVVDALMSLQNAKDVLAGKKPLKTLGVQAPSARKLIFRLDRDDGEFLHNLIDPAFAPRPKDVLDQHFSGPYVVKEIVRGKRVILKNNEHYMVQRDRPPVEILAVSDDDTALRLYETGDLHLMRRMTADAITKYRQRPDFFFVPMLRFDYVGFGPQLKDLPEVRKALALSVDYDSFVKVFHPLSPAGCAGLPKSFFTERPCYKQDLKKVKRKDLSAPELSFMFSLMGGADIGRQAEWFQNQWKIHAGLKVEIQGTEMALMNARLKSDPPPIFRRGVPLERPTCLGALEVFQKENPNNLIRFHDKGYERILAKLRTETSARNKRALCTQGVRILMDSHRIIPMGEIHYSMLKSPRFKNIEINNLNQLFLDTMHYVGE